MNPITIQEFINGVFRILQTIIREEDNIDPNSIQIWMDNDVVKVDGDKPYQEHAIAGTHYSFKWKYKKVIR